MECPYCGMELEEYDTFGKFRGGVMVEHLGDQYQCIYGRGEEFPEDKQQEVLAKLAEDDGMTPEEYLKENVDGGIENLVCPSEAFSGLFWNYVNEEDNLHEGPAC